MASPAAVLSVLVQARGIEQTNKKLQGIHTSSQKTAKSTGDLEKKFSNLDKSVGDFNRTFTASGNVMKLVKFPALIAGAGLAAQAMGAAAAGGVAVGSALAPLSGLYIGVAAGAVALKQAQGVVKLATHGVTEALAGNKKALKDLPPAGRDLVKLLNSLKPKFKELQQTAQAGLLPGLAAGVRAALPVLGPLKNIIGGTARVLGDLATQAGKLVGSKGVMRDLTTIGQTNTVVIRNAGKAGLLLAHAFIGVIAEAGPLVTWMSRLGVQLAGWIDKQVTAGRESGKLAGFLGQTRQVASTLIHILVNLGAALFNIGKAAAPLGRDLLGQFEKLTEKFRAWTASASGKNQIATYFANAKGPLMQVFGLVGDLGGAILRLSQGKGASALIAQLRTLVPVLEGVVSSTTSALGPALISSLGDVVRAFGLLAGSSGPLVQLVRLIGLLARGFTALLTSVPGLNSMTVSAIGLYGSVKALTVVFGPVAAGARALEVALIGQTAATEGAVTWTIRERIALVAMAIQEKAAAIATAGLTAATWLLDAALAILTSPITLVVVGLAALAAGIIYAYHHSETFRKIVNGMWAVLKVVAAWMVTAGVAAFRDVATTVRFAWGVVKAVTEVVWGGIRVYLTTLWTVLRTLITTYFGIYKAIITGAWTAIRIVTTAVWGAIRTATVAVWNALRDSAGTIWGGIRTAILTPIRAARDVLGGVWAQMRDAAHDAWQKMRTGAGNFAGDLKDTIVRAFEGGVNAVIDFVQKIIDVVWLIPGLGKKPKLGHIGGSKPKGHGGPGGPHGTGRLAKGGMVPGSGSGDKVPLHLGGRLAAMVEPGELVSVANRNATAALMGVNSAVPRFTTGGILNTQEMADLWRSKGGSASLADTMGVIGLVESGGNRNAVNPTSGATGIWQILGQLVPGNLKNVGINALNAIAKYKAQGLHAWDASRSKWEPLLGKKVGPDLNPLKLIGQLPGVGDLPDWLKGTGKWVLSHVGDWIKDNVAKLIPGGGGGTKGPKGVGSFNGVPMADWVIDALNYGRAHGAYGNPTSGYRPGFDSHTATGASEHQGTQYPHGAVDFGGFHDARALAEKMSYVRATAGYKYPLLAPQGFVDDGHASGTGHQRGGVLPFVGKFHGGGFADREGYAHVAKGEQIGGPLVNIENVHVGSRTDVNSFAERLAFRVATA